MNHSFITVSGQEFHKNKSPILFRGLGIGSWLNMEHFMLGIPTPDNRIRKSFAQVFGEEISARFFDSFINNFVTEKDFIFLKQLGVNVIRVPFNYRLFIDDNNPGVYKSSGFAYFDRLISLCRQYEIYLLPDLHTVPGGQNPDWHSDNNTGIPQFWHYKIFRDQIACLWQEIAGRYCEEEYILGYDILNEPYLIEAPDVLQEFYDDVTEKIRAVDNNHIIFLEGDHFAMKFDCIQSIQDSNTALTFHYYPTVWEPDLFQESVSPKERQDKFRQVLTQVASIRSTFNRPILCGEAGYDIDKNNIAHSMTLLKETLDLFQEYNISWTLWCYKDAQFMGLCYPKTDSPWMQFVSQIRRHWTHYQEMEQADAILSNICSAAPFEAASPQTRYFMQFRQRGILYCLQAECILIPLLKTYTAEEILALPDSFLFEQCEYYSEYADLLMRTLHR